MRISRLALLILACTQLLSIAYAGGPSSRPALPSYLITNEDLPPKVAFGATFFTLASDGTPQDPLKVNLGGIGVGGGLLSANRVSIFQDSTNSCAYLSQGSSNEIGAVDISALQDIGNFAAASTDDGSTDGIGLANNGTYLYANFSTSATIATFSIVPGCGLTFLGDIAPVGKHGGNVKGMAVHGSLLVVAYGDGSIESFNVSAGIPVSNGDLQNTSGYGTDRFAIAVDITQDNHFAVFGDQSNGTTIEVSDVSSGKLTKTAIYNVGTAGNSANIYLSPDESLLYITNTAVGKVSAAFFNATTGKVSPGCVSPTLRGFDTDWIFLATVVPQLNTGTGSVLYVAEYGDSSGVAVVNVSSSGGKCTLTESANSPVVDPYSTRVLSVGVYPPRQF